MTRMEPLGVETSTSMGALVVGAGDLAWLAVGRTGATLNLPLPRELRIEVLPTLGRPRRATAGVSLPLAILPRAARSSSRPAPVTAEKR